MMSGSKQQRGHSARRLIKARPDAIYRAFMHDSVRWMPPEGAVGTIELFEPREGGRFRLVLTFADAPGKSSANTDVVEGTFLRLRPDQEIVFGVQFESSRAEFGGT